MYFFIAQKYLPYSIVQCSAIQLCAVQCGLVVCSAVLCFMVLCGALWCTMGQNGEAWCSIVSLVQYGSCLCIMLRNGVILT